MKMCVVCNCVMWRRKALLLVVEDNCEKFADGRFKFVVRRDGMCFELVLFDFVLHETYLT